MKKFFGVLLLIIGLFLIATGMFGMGNTNGARKCDESQIEMLPGYSSKRESEMVIGGTVVVIGLVFNIVGIVLLATKTQKQRIMEAEFAVLKGTKPSGTTFSKEEIVYKMEQLIDLKAKGLLSEGNYIEEKRKLCAL